MANLLMVHILLYNPVPRAFVQLMKRNGGQVLSVVQLQGVVDPLLYVLYSSQSGVVLISIRGVAWELLRSVRDLWGFWEWLQTS